MILHGAEGNTASQLKKGLSIKDFDVVKNGFRDALTLLKTNENFTLNAANRYVFLKTVFQEEKFWEKNKKILYFEWKFMKSLVDKKLSMSRFLHHTNGYSRQN